VFDAPPASVFSESWRPIYCGDVIRAPVDESPASSLSRPASVDQERRTTETGPQPAEQEAAAGWILAIATSADRAAFAALFGSFAPRVKSYMLRLGLTDSVAEELAQDTLFAVWRKADQFDPSRAKAAGWIFSIARNLRVDLLRREHSRREIFQPEAASDPLTPEQEMKILQGEERVRQAVDALPGEQADVLRLSFFEELSHPEIALRLALPLGTVKSRIRRATVNLRAALDDLA